MVVSTVNKFRPNLYKRRIVMATESRVFIYVQSEQDLYHMFACMTLELLEYDFDVRYRNSTANRNADSVSPIPCEISSLAKTVHW